MDDNPTWFPGWSDLPCDPRAPSGSGGPGGFLRPGPWRDIAPDVDGCSPWAPAARLGTDPAPAAAPAPVPTAVPWETTAADFARWEGRIQHMYQDTEGLVTVGVGKMLPDVAAAQALAFVHRSDGLTATPADIQTDFKAVAAQPKAQPAASYRAYTLLDLPDAVIDTLLRSTVKALQSGLSLHFKGYGAYPAPAQRALLDMAYNLGLTGLLKFKKLQASAEAGKWKDAAAQCHRVGPSQERNDWTRDLFLEAAK